MTKTATAPQITETEMEFFTQFQHQVNTFGLLNTFEEREDRNLFRNIQRRLDWVAPVKKVRVTLTIEELTPMFEEYLATYTPEGKVKVFDRKLASEGCEAHRQDPGATAMCIHGQLVWYDQFNKTISKHFDRTGKNLKQLMTEYNEQTGTKRFAV